MKRSVLTKVTYIYCSLTTISRRSQGLWCLVPLLVVIAVTPVPSGTGPAAVAAYSCSALKHVAVDVAWLEYLSSTPWIKKVLEVKRECKMESSRIGIWPTRELLSCLCRHWPGTRRVLTGTHRVLTGYWQAGVGMFRKYWEVIYCLLAHRELVRTWVRRLPRHYFLGCTILVLGWVPNMLTWFH